MQLLHSMSNCDNMDHWERNDHVDSLDHWKNLVLAIVIRIITIEWYRNWAMSSRERGHYRAIIEDNISLSLLWISSLENYPIMRIMTLVHSSDYHRTWRLQNQVLWLGDWDFDLLQLKHSMLNRHFEVIIIVVNLLMTWES